MSDESPTGFIDILRLSPSARYAFQGMSFLAQKPVGQFVLVEEVAAAGQLPKDFLAKIFQKLAHRGFLTARRGPGGGYALARPADEITLIDILRTIEDTSPKEKCLMEQRSCNLSLIHISEPTRPY